MTELEKAFNALKKEFQVFQARDVLLTDVLRLLCQGLSVLASFRMNEWDAETERIIRECTPKKQVYSYKDCFDKPFRLEYVDENVGWNVYEERPDGLGGTYDHYIGVSEAGAEPGDSERNPPPPPRSNRRKEEDLRQPGCSQL
jgi:hypothetical protein